MYFHKHVTHQVSRESRLNDVKAGSLSYYITVDGVSNALLYPTQYGTYPFDLCSLNALQVCIVDVYKRVHQARGNNSML